MAEFVYGKEFWAVTGWYESGYVGVFVWALYCGHAVGGSAEYKAN